MTKLLTVKPKKLHGFGHSRKLRYGEIPRRIVVDGKVWTWKNKIWELTFNETIKEYQHRGFHTKVVSIKGNRQLYIRGK